MTITANAYQSESCDVRPRQERPRRRGVAEQRIDEALGEHLAEVRAELEAVGVDDEHLAAGDEHVEIVEVADHDAPVVDRRDGRGGARASTSETAADDSPPWRIDGSP